jgi:hypothetical protein
MSPPIKSESPVKHFVLAFVIALAGYAVTYHLIEHRRVRNGPWQVTFTVNSNGAPALVIRQPTLAITNLQIDFAGETFPTTNASQAFDYAQPRPVPYPVPFGTCVFMDTTFLPGTLTLDVFGHEIELLPRVLVIDLVEHPWRSGATITLPPASAKVSTAK